MLSLLKMRTTSWGGVIEQSGYEATVMDMDDLRNECVREKEEDLNRILLRNHKDVNKGCSQKKKSPVWAFPIPFWKVACNDGDIWYYCTLCQCVDPST